MYDGNGWTHCDLGHWHWGRHGAVGLLLVAPGRDGAAVVLLQLRSRWVSHGRTWSPPGGARDSHESAVSAALRETAEECAIDSAEVTVFGLKDDDHGGWSYQTVLASAPRPLSASPASAETREVAWTPIADVERLALHPGFAAQWPALRSALEPMTIVVDVANVMGSRPDGWWRDRAGAAGRLIGQLAGLAARGISGSPDSVLPTGLTWYYPRFVAVVEGAATAVTSGAGTPDRRLVVARASGSGDDEIVRQVALAAGPVLVVTADRQLRARCEQAGAQSAGPRWLTGLLAATE